LISTALVNIPAYTAPVVDLTQTLSAAQTTQLIQQINQAESSSEKGTQLAVLMVPTTEEESIEQFATRVFDNWQIGAKNKDNGVLLVIAKQDRTLRIEVGYGLEGNITDLQSGRIIRNTIVPYFQQNDYYQGIQAGLNNINSLLNHDTTYDESQEEEVVGYFQQFT